MKIAAGRFKAQCLSLMDQVRDTRREVIITKRGKAVAKLVPADDAPREVLGCMAGTATLHGDVLAPAVDPAEWEQLA